MIILLLWLVRRAGRDTCKGGIMCYVITQNDNAVLQQPNGDIVYFPTAKKAVEFLRKHRHVLPGDNHIVTPLEDAVDLILQ